MILVVGATGGTGKIAVRMLLDRGENVRAFARHATSLEAHDNLERIDGDVRDARAIGDAVRGASAVVSFLGPAPGSAPMLCGQGTANLVHAMKDHRVRRLVCVTGAMIGHAHERLGLVYRFIESRVPSEDIADRRAQERMVLHSNLDWTIVRPTRLTDGAMVERVRAGEDFVVHAFDHVPRANVARFVLEALDRRETIGKAYTLAA